MPATAENILADFDGTEFTLGDMHVAFRIAADGHYAFVTESDGSTHDYKVHSVAGVTPLQQYLFETEPGRLQSFDVVWDTQKDRWFHLYPDTNPAPSDGLHWTGAYKTWNSRCAACHVASSGSPNTPLMPSFPPSYTRQPLRTMCLRRTSVTAPSEIFRETSLLSI